jgi:uncharacterized ParB-like nuclease family protein
MMADQTEIKLDDIKRSKANQDDSESIKAMCELNERLRFCNEAIRACDEFLCCPLRVFGKPNIKRRSGEMQKLPVPGVCKMVNEKLNVSSRGSVKPKPNLVMPRLLKRVIHNVCGFFGCHKTSGADKQSRRRKLNHRELKSMQINNLLGQSEAILAVGVLLGCLFVTLIILIRMLWMLQKQEREINENRRLYHECNREILKMTSVLLQSQAGNIGKLAEQNMERAKLDHNRGDLFRVSPNTNRQLCHVLNPVPRFLSRLFFGVHKSKNAAKQPNR